jgi:hypothetical protein
MVNCNGWGGSCHGLEVRKEKHEISVMIADVIQHRTGHLLNICQTCFHQGNLLGPKGRATKLTQIEKLNGTY